MGSYWRPPGQIQENDPNEFWHCAVPHIFSFLFCITLELIPSKLLKLNEELESPEFDLLAILLLPAHSFWSTHSLNTEFNVNPSGQMHLKQKLSFIFRIETSIFRLKDYLAPRRIKFLIYLSEVFLGVTPQRGGDFSTVGPKKLGYFSTRPKAPRKIFEHFFRNFWEIC